MEYLNRFKSTVHSVAAQVTQALPGNPIFREYECHDQIATAGPGHAWKIYSGTKHSTKQSVSIWLFDKKYCDKWSKQDKEAFPELLKRGISQLTRLRHPRLLIVEHALEESRDTLAFCTEPVFASLANIFGEDDHGQGMDSKFSDFKLEDIEIRHGLFQLGEALAFLHNDAKLLHGNICPSSVIINEKGAWKLSGFDFCILGAPNPNGKITFSVTHRDRRALTVLHPVLDYSAPEFVDATKCDHFADIFSLGILSFAIFNGYRPIYSSGDVLDAYEKNCEKLRKLTINEFTRIPADFRDDVKACLNFTPELRPDAIQFTKIAYFDDTLVKTLNYLDSLMQMDNTQKMQFFKGLPQVLAKFPQRALVQKVFPYLVAEFNTPQLIPFILPSIFIIAEQAKDDEFSKIIFPQLIPIFSMTNPYQIVLLLLQKMTLFLQKTPEGDIKRYVLPLIYGAIMNENTKIQELCLNIIPTVGKLVERDQMKTQLLPKLIRLSLEGPVLAGHNTLEHRQNLSGHLVWGCLEVFGGAILQSCDNLRIDRRS
uniref:Protein kinase domain-containing protein n=1 Tax=Panagrellus redivivus TaxID=6233 RepID=A0A7E4V891_PANRE